MVGASQLAPVLPARASRCVHDVLRWERDQAKSEDDLRHFSIRNAVCAVESDRAVVERNVASLMRDLKLVPSDSTHEEALQVFDRVVQSTLPSAMRSSTRSCRDQVRTCCGGVLCILVQSLRCRRRAGLCWRQQSSSGRHRARKNHLGLCPHASWYRVSLGAEWSMHALQWWEQGPLRAVAFWIVDGVDHLGERSA